MNIDLYGSLTITELKITKVLRLQILTRQRSNIKPRYMCVPLKDLQCLLWILQSQGCFGGNCSMKRQSDRNGVSFSSSRWRGILGHFLNAVLVLIKTNTEVWRSFPLPCRRKSLYVPWIITAIQYQLIRISINQLLLWEGAKKNSC